MQPPAIRTDAVRSWDRAAVATGVAVLAWIFYHQLLAASRVIDGKRYFVLDDDMMVSMRYARNLAEGNGLVWNPGDRVEGYTNFLWTLVMAGVHVLPIDDAHTAVAVMVVAFALLAATLHLSVRLLRVFAPQPLLAGPLLVLALVTCIDVVHWTAWGFETSLLGFLELVFLVCLLEQRRMPAGWVALALVPLVRSDSVHLFAADAVLALLLTTPRRRAAVRIGLCAVPFALHLVFRRAYYGDWLPNTYYLKLQFLDDRFERGLSYTGNFLLQYAVVLTVAAVAAIAVLRTDRRGWTFFVVLGTSLTYVVTAGGDMLLNYRFLAHVMPLVFVFAVVGVVKAASGTAGPVLVGVVFLVAGAPLSALTTPGNNGDPREQLQLAVLVKKNAHPDSSIAVIAAGIVPYFTRLEAVDVLGKSDRYIARLRPFPGSKIGHGKIDPGHSLSKDPDLVVSYVSLAAVRSLPPGSRSTNYVGTFLGSSAFQSRYLPQPIAEAFLLEHTAVFTYRGSREDSGRRWVPVVVRP